MLWCCINANVSYFTHHACPFLKKKIQSSLTPVYLEPHTGDVITSYWQEDTAFFCQHSFRMCRLNCQFFHWPWTAWESLYQFLLPLSSLPHFLCLSSAHAFGCRVCLQLTCTAPHNGLYLHSQQSNTHSPTNPTVCTILKWTWSTLKQRPEVCFTQSALSQQGKG